MGGMNTVGTFAESDMSNFNPHPRMGMNINITYFKKREWRLQPTPPYGDEQKAMQQIVDRENYNPHPVWGWT